MRKILFLVNTFLIWNLFCLPYVEAHTVHRTNPIQYQFSESDNQSGLQESDVQHLFQILNAEFSEQIPNATKSWTSGFNWQQSYMGAGSTLVDQDFTVMLWGGFVRAKYMTFGALAATVCHELGHKLAGAPFQRFPGSDPDWSSAEGQSDYFAASVCLPRVYEALKKESSPYLIEPAEPSTVLLCQPLIREKEKFAKCIWVATSGINLIQMMQVYYETDIPFADPTKWSVEKPTETLHTKYPSYQCRMDTFKMAAKDPTSDRLRCWFVR